MFRKHVKKIPGAVWLAKSLGLAGVPDQSRRFLLEQLPRNSVGAEIGVHVGDFSRQILDVVRPSKLYLIDPWEHQEGEQYKNAWYGGKVLDGQAAMDARHDGVGARFADEIGRGVVEVRRGYSTDVLESMDDGSLDWVYIDGNHLYEFVKRDLELSFRKVRPGGFVTGDDYTEGGWWGGGVKRAVDEYAEQLAGSLVQIKDRQFIFRKPALPGAEF